MQKDATARLEERVHAAQKAIARVQWESGDRPHLRDCSPWVRSLGSSKVKGMRVFSQWNQDGVLQLILRRL